MQLPCHPLSSQQSSELLGKACHVTHFEPNIIRRWQAADKELLIGALTNLTEYEADFPRLLRTGDVLADRKPIGTVLMSSLSAGLLPPLHSVHIPIPCPKPHQ